MWKQIGVSHRKKPFLPESISNIYRTSIENLSNIDRKTIENLLNIYRTSIEHPPNTHLTSIEHLSSIYRASTNLDEIPESLGGKSHAPDSILEGARQKKPKLVSRCFETVANSTPRYRLKIMTGFGFC